MKHIVNINYRGRVLSKLDNEDFARKNPPQMLIYKCEDNCKLIVFKSGKCHIMGCKKPITNVEGFPLPILLTGIMSVTACFDMQQPIHLYTLAMNLGQSRCMYEPELFPALRITKDYLPYCVNVFSSGKVTILGIKGIQVDKLCHSVRSYIHQWINRSQSTAQ